MKLNKLIAVAAAAVLMTACGAGSASQSTAASAPAAEPQHAEYTVYNSTGADVTELYLYEAGSEDKGENYAANGFAHGENIVLTRDAASEEEAKSKVYVLEFVSNGETQSFDTLHFEVAPIALKSVDAAAGATAIAFAVPEFEQHAEYTVYNTTGAVVTELYLYEAGSEDKGENYAGEGMAMDAVVTLTRTAASEEEAKSKVYVLEFVCNDQTQSFDTLHFEVAPISLKSVDAAAGATPIAFTQPE